MGSKRVMLEKGLGNVIRQQSKNARRIVDLFCGAASVSWFAASQLRKPVLACDLQEYAVALAGAVIKRNQPVNIDILEQEWLRPAHRLMCDSELWPKAQSLDNSGCQMSVWHRKAQEFCYSLSTTSTSLVFRCYGGSYFSPTQALAFDAMLEALPRNTELSDVCLAATIMAASYCVASPGHTAQPFKATHNAAKYLRVAWSRDPFYYARKGLEKICPLYSTRLGETFVGDANHLAEKLDGGDLVFVDPPYSAVQYSRFYHVLETIARRNCGKVEGEGRYPPQSQRPRSLYSQKSKSNSAARDLLSKLSSNGCTVVLTFPQEECSNGLSGKNVEDIARQLFKVKRKSVKSKFSTLGGNSINRVARNSLNEFMLVLKPR